MNEARARIWTMLQKSDSDLQVALTLSKTNIPGKVDQVGFHLQQSVEKSLKVILMLNGIEYSVVRKAGHDLRALLNLASNSQPDLPADRNKILRLQGFAVDGRYDDTEASVTIDLNLMIDLAIDFYGVAHEYYELKKS